ncbi:hypothetical protein AMAG_20117 [Allomyces macrogynus ATCC 38327]|uniref:C3H1-type domain-containing protein n=1 Tax=Allomyces macrogynus (strain ATCC 38327) TaxID=578462 RepID=A0A0L0T6R9_ALLM3|nr:hypothetical protein AMAG_20117 [Allomyces macrogynus ATCC 38327]|eukprot:KNE70442.1 hypothetical protein AMAG_20117 [Allomyces macrogynus ATCC 38327]
MDPRLRGRPHAGASAPAASSSTSTGFTRPLTFGSSAPAPAPAATNTNATAPKFTTPLYYSNARTASPASNQAAPLPPPSTSTWLSTSYGVTQYPAAAQQQKQQQQQQQQQQQKQQQQQQQQQQQKQQQQQQQQQQKQQQQQQAPPAPSTGSAWSSTGFAPPLNFAPNATPAAPAPAPTASVYSAYAPANYAAPAMPAIPGMGMLPGAAAEQQPTMASLMAANAVLRQQLQIQALQMQLQQKQFAGAAPPAPVAPAMPALPPLATPMMAPTSTMYSAMAYPSTYETVEKKLKARSNAGLPPRPHAPRANKGPLPGPPVPENAVVTAPLPPPTPTSYECDACEKSFSSLDQYRTHTRTHVQCSQCNFVASGRVVKQHEEDMHGIGKEAKEIPSWCKIKLDTPEALAKWIEDRKKRYPTDANIQKKKDEIAAKIARGELLPNGKRPPKPRPERPVKRPRTNADGEDDAPDQLGTNDGAAATDASEGFAPVHKSHRICVYWRRGHCRNGDNCRFRHDPGCAPRGSPAAREAAKKAGAAGAVPRQHLRRKPLLAKLLEREMHLEHSHILQCLRFMVNNRFFVEGVTWTGQLPIVEEGGEGDDQGQVEEVEERTMAEERPEKDDKDVPMDQDGGDGHVEDEVITEPTLPPGRMDGGEVRVASSLPPADAGEPEDGEIEEGEVGPMDEVLDEAMDEVPEAVAQPVEEEGAIMVDPF